MTAAAAPTSSAPQCNRVTLTGEIIAIRERGTFMGNRTSPPRWLICDLHFKRDLKEPRKYAKLFFLEELRKPFRPGPVQRRAGHPSIDSRIITVMREIGTLDPKRHRRPH